MSARENTAFICYRRRDTQSIVGRLFADLARDIGRKRVFKDTDSIPGGVSFPDHIAAVLARCRVVLVVIGPRWLERGVDGKEGRLFDKGDHVRGEISAALSAGVPVLPILYGGAAMPERDQVPRDLEPLTMLNGRLLREDPDYQRDYEAIRAWIRSEFAKKPRKEPRAAQRATADERVPDKRRLSVALALAAVLALGGGVVVLARGSRRGSAETETARAAQAAELDRLKKIEEALASDNLMAEHKLEEVRRLARAGDPSRRFDVLVKSAPAGADVFVEGGVTPAGETPVTLPIDLTAKNSVKLILRKEGYEDYEQRVASSLPLSISLKKRESPVPLPAPAHDAQATKTSNVRRKTTPSGKVAGTLVVMTSPRGAKVVLDGVSRGETPFKADGVNAATPHVLELKKAGFRNYDHIIRATDWSSNSGFRALTLDVDLEKSRPPVGGGEIVNPWAN